MRYMSTSFFDSIEPNFEITDDGPTRVVAVVKLSLHPWSQLNGDEYGLVNRWAKSPLSNWSYGPVSTLFSRADAGALTRWSKVVATAYRPMPNTSSVAPSTLK